VWYKALDAKLEHAVALKFLQLFIATGYYEGETLAQKLSRHRDDQAKG
jgi:hypothetical protein